MVKTFNTFINEANTETLQEEAVLLLRSISKSFKTNGHDVIIPEKDGEDYPLGIVPGDYTKQEIAEALQFIADMME